MSVETVEQPWSPSETDYRTGADAYIHYLGGVGIINAPDSPFAKDILGSEHDVTADPETVLTYAEVMMYTGLRGVIKAANPPTPHQGIDRLEKNFADALPIMLDVRDRAVTGEATVKRISRINEAFLALAPFPLEDASLYKAMCHGGRRNVLQTLTFVDNYPVAKAFEGLIVGRTLSNSRTGSIKRLIASGANR